MRDPRRSARPRAGGVGRRGGALDGGAVPLRRRSRRSARLAPLYRLRVGVATRAVIFDMDGVLIDSGAHHRAAWRALLDELGVVPAEPDYWRLTIGRPSVEAVPLLLGRETSWAEAQRLAARKQEHYRRLAGGGPALVRGVAEFVTELAARSVPRAVATSASRHDVDALLTRARLRDRLRGRRGRRGRPARQARSRGLPARRRPARVSRPSSCLVFEDAVVGVQAARSAGMRAIGVSTAHTETELRGGRRRARRRGFRRSLMASVSTSDFWTDLYARGADGWDIRQPTPPLVEFIGSHAARRPAASPCRAAGAATTCASWPAAATPRSASTSPRPRSPTRARSPRRDQRDRRASSQRDLFTLGRDYGHAFDGIWEYTCFCAIEPRRRASLRPHDARDPEAGRLAAGLLLPHAPHRRRSARYPVSRAEVQRRFGPQFRFERAQPPLRSARAAAKAASGSCSPVTSSQSPAAGPGSAGLARRASGGGRRAEGRVAAGAPSRRAVVAVARSGLGERAAGDSTGRNPAPSGGWGARYRPG